MDTKLSKIKGMVTSFLSLALSLDGIVLFSFFAFFKSKALIPFLFAAAYFLFEASGRVYALSYTLANRHEKEGRAKEAKARLALTMGVADSLYTLPWILTVFCCANLSSSEVGVVPLLFLLSKISAELVLSFFRLLPYQKRRITLSSESMCSFCFALSFFLALLFAYLSNSGRLDSQLATILTGVSFLVLFLIQNAFFSILLIQGQAIQRIKKMVLFGMKHSVGNYIVVSSSLMTFLVSSVSAAKEKNLAYVGIALIYLTLGAIRLSALLWKNAIHRNVYNARLAEARENKILLYAGALLAGLSVFFAFGIIWISEQELRQSAAIVLIFQIAHGLFRLAICIKNYVSFQRKSKPFSIAVASLDMLIGVYSLFSVSLLINLYLNLSWMKQFIAVLSWMTLGGVAALGAVMICLGLRGYKEARRLGEEIKKNSAILQAKLKGIADPFSKGASPSLMSDPEFVSCLHRLSSLGPSSPEEERILAALEPHEAPSKANESS